MKIETAYHRRVGSGTDRNPRTAMNLAPPLCETKGMANYAPKIGDRILLEGHTERFVVVGLDVPRMTADVSSIVGERFPLRNVPWESISDVEEGQGPGQTNSEVAKNK